MSTDRLAFFIGLLGSLHCIGMCGPLAFSVPVLRTGFWHLFLDKISYQTGRVIAYVMLGLLIGTLGRQLWLLEFQQSISIISGLLILAVASSRIFRISKGYKKGSLLLKPFHRLLSFTLKHKANHLIIGFVNGLLPCGFVYLALIGALNTGSISNAASYMFWFGCGTVPLMLIATLSMNFTGKLLRAKINAVLPYMMACLGVWFILRGLALDIPYLSPKQQESSITTCK